MEVKSSTIESLLKSFTFSCLLCVYVGFSAVMRTRSLFIEFGWIELLRLVYCVCASLFFLIRVRLIFLFVSIPLGILTVLVLGRSLQDDLYVVYLKRVKYGFCRACIEGGGWCGQAVKWSR